MTRSQIGVTLPAARTALITAAAAGAAVFAGLQIGSRSSIGVGTVLIVLFVPIVFANAPLGIAIWLGLLFSQWLEGINSAENVASGLLALTAIGLLAERDGHAREALRRHALLVGLVVAFGMWLAMTSLWAEQTDLALRDVKHWLLAIYLLPVAIVLVAATRDARVVIAGFVLGAAVAVFVGFLEQSLQSTAKSLVAAASPSARLQGGAGDPNYLAAALVPAVVLAAALIPATRRTWLKLLLGLTMIFLAGGLGATESRGGLIAASAAVVASLALLNGNRRSAAIIACVLVGVSVVWYASSPAALARIESARIDKGSGRVDLWRAAWAIGQDQPVIGVGLNQFTVYKSRYARSLGEVSSVDQLAEAPQVAHSVYLQLWAEAGIIGLALFLAIVVTSLRAAVRATRVFATGGRRDHAAIAGAIAVAVLGMCAASVFLSNGTDKRLWLLLGLGPAMLILAERERRAPGATARSSEMRSALPLPSPPSRTLTRHDERARRA